MEELIKLGPDRLPEMAELYKIAFRGEPWNDDWSDPVQLNEYVKEISSSYNCLNYGLLIDGELAAMSLGMIRQFMKLIEKEIKQMGLAGIFLQTDNDKPSYRFYKKNGFKELETHVSFYKSVKE